ncbi:phage major capsid protein [Blastochloris tepida]|uniref:Phage capsid-like C-terminal domain-containing protein n=1 Tax=Blastochloris tepida TaxID=2233851 RepID=A0A348G1D8_9HYPH|nr:phage major capsid protein [Blastochloris tepida]BBF93371.1 hypothetical protein BLTE_20560 [Blastochloris tepida]
MNLKQLRQARADKAKAGKTKLDELNALLAKENASDADKARIDALDTEVTALEKDVADLDAAIAREEQAARRATLFGVHLAGGGNAAQNIRVSSSEPNPETTGGFRSLAEFAVAVRAAATGGGLDPRLAASPSNVHQTSGSAGEGYMIPPDFRTSIWEAVFNEGDLLPRIAPSPTNSNAVGIIKDESTPWGAAGVQAAWRAEGAVMTPSKQATKGALVQLHEIYAFVAASDEVLADAPLLQDRLTRRAAQAIRWKVSDAIMWGDGVGKPLGFMNAGALVTQGKESAQTADTIVTKNVTKMLSRIVPGGIGQAFWLATSEALPQIVELSIGTTPMWTSPNAGLQQSPGGNLLGRPIVFSQHASAIGDLGDIALIDPEGYFLATKAGGGIDFAASIHLWFDYALTAFRWTFRVGGQPLLSAPISPARGSNTTSHFVTLEAR